MTLAKFSQDSTGGTKVEMFREEYENEDDDEEDEFY